MNRTLLVAALPFLVSCDAVSADFDARKSCEQGATLIREAQAMLAPGKFVPANRLAIRSNLGEGIIQIRLGLARHPGRGWFFNPDKYRAIEATGITLYDDPRLTPNPILKEDH